MRAPFTAAARLARVHRGALACAALAATLALTGSAGATADRGGAATATEVLVDVRATRQVINGFGTSNRVWSDPHLPNAPNVSIPASAQTQILSSLYGRLGLTRVRNVLDQGVQRTRGGPFSFSGKLADDHVAFVKQARRFGLKTYFPGPVYMEPWMTADDVGAYVDWAMAMLKRWRAKGLEPAYYAPLNEPEINNDFSPQWLRDVVLQLGKRLRANGFATKLVIPDDENPRDAYTRAVAVLSDPAARRYVGAVAYHIYRWDKSWTGEIAKVRALATRYGLPVWMTEYSSRAYTDWGAALEWAEKMHVLLTAGGVNAIDYMWGYFGSWVKTDTMIAIDFDGSTYRGHSATPLYWLTGHYSRFVRPGYARVATTPSSGPVLVSAYKGPKQVVVVAVNPQNRSERVTVRLRGTAVRGQVGRVRSSASERWRALAPVRASNGTFSETLPPQSIVTFVAGR